MPLFVKVDLLEDEDILTVSDTGDGDHLLGNNGLFGGEDANGWT